MKKVFAVALLTLAVSAIASAQALQPNWSFSIRADNGAGMYSMAALTIGVSSVSKDGYGVDGTTSDDNDARSVFQFIPDDCRGIITVQKKGTSCLGWMRNTQSARSPLDPAYDAGESGPNGSAFGMTPCYEAHAKIWDLRVFALQPSPLWDPNNTIRLRFKTTQIGYLLPTTFQTESGSTAGAKYFLRMVDNKSMDGAPENGAIWDIPIPTAASQTFFTLTLPRLNIDDKVEDLAISQGYQMQFIQTAVPEPSSLVALAGGLMGLAGFTLRRRR